MFGYEAAGLEELSASGAVSVPRVHVAEKDLLVMSWVVASTPNRTMWESFGEALARMHLVTGERFGFHMDGYCGAGVQRNPWEDDGHVFFLRHRIEPQVRSARDSGLLDGEEARRIDSLMDMLERLIPVQPASLVHGDLWQGNVMFSDDGAVLIDPAAHYGWAEADLAMTRLFGGFDAGFYGSYFETNPVHEKFDERADLYNLYHLLNHLNIFGRGYHSQVMDVVNRFAGN